MENTNYFLQEKIQSFVNGELDEANRRDLLEQSDKEPATADEVIFSQSLARVLRHRDLVAASVVLSGVLASEPFPPPITAVGTWPRWRGWIIGSILLILFSGTAYWIADQKGYFISENQLLSRAALQPLENVLFLSGKDGDLTNLQAGMAAYDAGRYADADRLLSAYVSSRQDYAAQVYLGISKLLTGAHQAAIATLSDATQSQEPPVREAAQWYLALAHLENNQPQRARPLLESLPEESVFSQQAQNLLRQLSPE